MKTLIALFILSFSLSSFALTKAEVSALLKEKGVDLLQMEMKGMKTLMGEVTGHINQIPFSKVQVLVTEHEAILKSEIEAVDFNGTQNLGGVVSVRAHGQYILKEDVKATIVIGQ